MKINTRGVNVLTVEAGSIHGANGTVSTSKAPSVSDQPARAEAPHTGMRNRAKPDGAGIHNFLDLGDGAIRDLVKLFDAVATTNAADATDNRASFNRMRSFVAGYMFGARKISEPDRPLLKQFTSNWLALSQQQPQMLEKLGFGTEFHSFVQLVANLLAQAGDPARKANLIVVRRTGDIRPQ